MIERILLGLVVIMILANLACMTTKTVVDYKMLIVMENVDLDNG